MPGFRLLACFAHPDNEAFPVGGALAAHAARGVAVRLVTATSGEAGTPLSSPLGKGERGGSRPRRRPWDRCAVPSWPAPLLPWG